MEAGFGTSRRTFQTGTGDRVLVTIISLQTENAEPPNESNDDWEISKGNETTMNNLQKRPKQKAYIMRRQI